MLTICLTITAIVAMVCVTVWKCVKKIAEAKVGSVDDIRRNFAELGNATFSRLDRLMDIWESKK